MGAQATTGSQVRLGSPSGRWVLLAAVLGSAVVALDATVVNVALPAIGRELHAGVTGLQWTLDSYLVTLASLILVGGSLGDHLGRRRVFVLGLASFAAASLVSGAAPNLTLLIVGKYFLPIFLKNGITTMPHFLEIALTGLMRHA